MRDHVGRRALAEVDFDARTAYDFVVSLMVLTGNEAELLPEDVAWLERQRKALPEAARQDLEECFGESALGAFGGISSIIVERPELRDAADFAEAVGQLSDRELARYIVRDVLCYAGAEELADSVVDGERGALDMAHAALDDKQRAIVDSFMGDMSGKIGRLRRSIEAWLPVYREIEPRVADMLERDLLARRSDRHALEPVELIERTTGGLRWLPEANARRVIMAPTYFGRPFNHIFQGSDWRLFVYPLTEDAMGPTDSSVPPQAAVRLYRALGDSTRMRVLRLLSDRDWYLTELAQQLELSKPTMKHHLALLRAAGLVTVTDEGSMTYYSLRRDRVREAGLELQRYLG
ncbi:MAG TPA: metalloregulator ArsR/SmtB family transcription factor [Candidatus Limnocylindria bacterium]|nr:metalloregulator ArsR/SmtB family transcription factor [Candidatus Limnocylindria bacterium]